MKWTIEDSPGGCRLLGRKAVRCLAEQGLTAPNRPWCRVMLVLAQVSSMNTRRRGSMRSWDFFHHTRRRAMSGRSCSSANTDFLRLPPAPRRNRRNVSSAPTTPRWCSSPAKAFSVRSGFSARWTTSHSRSPTRLLRPGRPPIGLAAGLPPWRARCDHFTTLATLTRNTRATSRHDCPSPTAATTRSRRSEK